jgi:hypothetical protein
VDEVDLGVAFTVLGRLITAFATDVATAGHEGGYDGQMGSGEEAEQRREGSRVAALRSRTS